MAHCDADFAITKPIIIKIEITKAKGKDNPFVIPFTEFGKVRRCRTMRGGIQRALSTFGFVFDTKQDD
jgi:hypothetical protein